MQQAEDDSMFSDCFSTARLWAIPFVVVVLGTMSAPPAMAEYQGSVLYAATAPPNFIHQNPPIFPVTAPQAAGGGQVVGEASDVVTSGFTHAFVWKSDGTPVDLHSNQAIGFLNSSAIGTNGSQQVGAAWNNNPSGPNDTSAVMWNGSASSVVNLAPTLLPNIHESQATVTSGNQQLGLGSAAAGSLNHALLWFGTAESARDLNPAGFDASEAVATNGTSQVGDAGITGGGAHAMLWSGTAASAIDLHPTNLGLIDNSKANGISPDGSEQVGSASGPGTGGNSHAILWRGAADTAVDIEPTNLPGLAGAFAVATNGEFQVGEGDFGNSRHILLWNNGDPNTVTDLSALLTKSYWTTHVYSIDAAGNVFALGQTSLYGWDAIEWSPAVPEPASVVVLGIAGIAALRRRRV